MISESYSSAILPRPPLFLDSVLMGCMFLKSCPFLLGCQIFWHIVLHSILLWFFSIAVVLVEISPFSFLILFVWVSSLFFSSW